MKKLTLFCLAALLLLTACGQQSAARAERSKPRVSVTSMTVTLRRVPAANADIAADGTLRIDDVVVPLQPAQQAQLQSLYGQLQILRQNAITEAGPDPKMTAVPLQATPQIDALKAEVLGSIDSLKPYEISFTRLRGERH